MRADCMRCKNRTMEEPWCDLKCKYANHERYIAQYKEGRLRSCPHFEFDREAQCGR